MWQCGKFPALFNLFPEGIVAMAEIVAFPYTWERNLVRKKAGDPSSEPLPILQNVVVCLKDHPKMLDFLAYDRALHDIVIERGWPSPYGHEGLANPTDWRTYPRLWEPDYDEPQLMLWLEAHGVYLRNQRMLGQGARLVADERPRDSRAARLAGLPAWDGVRRLNDVPRYVLRAEGTKFEQLAFRRWLISAVARTILPGCKADHMLVIEGGQGLRKSQFARALPLIWTDAGEVRDFEEVKRLGESIKGKWIVEVEELAAYSKGKVEVIKAAISRQFDTYRPPYERKARDFQRTCVFIGTTNATEYLKDVTGQRRFWPIRCGVRDDEFGGTEINVNLWERFREQIWAEAVAAYYAGEIWYFTKEEEASLAKEVQDSRVEVQTWEHVLLDYLGGVCIGEKLRMANVTKYVRDSTGDKIRMDVLTAHLKAQGWESVKESSGREKGRRFWVKK